MILLPFELAGWFAALAMGIVMAVYVVASSAGAVIATAVAAPVLSGAVVLLYADLRMRGEGTGAALQPMAPPATRTPGR